MLQAPAQLDAFGVAPSRLRRYGGVLTAAENVKGVLDVDSVKGCSDGMAAHPGRGCYGDCYAARIARYRGFDFSTSVVRRFADREHLATVRRIVADHPEAWYRIGVHGDPSYSWAHTLHVCKYLWPTGKTPVIVTKHWRVLTDEQLGFLGKLRAVVNTSVSGMDSDVGVEHRLGQAQRIRSAGIASVVRVVTCDFGQTEWGVACAERQRRLLEQRPLIDNPFRPNKMNPRVISGDVLIQQRTESIGGRYVSLHSQGAYLGHCSWCLDQCGLNLTG